MFLIFNLIKQQPNELKPMYAQKMTVQNIQQFIYTYESSIQYQTKSMGMKNIHILLLTCFFQLSLQNQKIIGKVVEIQPVALEVILPIYDRVVVFFTSGIKPSTSLLYQESVKQLLAEINQEMVNKTLFAICDLNKDQSGKLKKFGARQGVQLITAITHYQLIYPSDANDPNKLTQFFQQVPNFIKLHTSSKAEVIDWQEAKNKEAYSNGFVLLITPSNSHQQEKANIIYKKIFDYLSFFNTKLVINKRVGEQSVDLYRNGKLESNYAGSAVEALFNFTTQPSKEQIYDLIQFINVQTIDDVTFLSQDNYFRVFGVQYQILMVFHKNDTGNQEIKKILTQYEKAAFHNKRDGLKYERILFAVAHAEFLTDYFADQVLEKNQLYTIMLTNSDYSSFQLRKFVYQEKQVTSDKLIEFISNVKLKKIDAKYKSQQIENNQDKKIRKIVGKNFQKEIFEQPEKSVMVLFIDSKDPSSSQNFIKEVNSFAQKYYEAYKDHLHIGIFDLSKNEHKLLTISTAPQLVLFERTNKKKPKFFKGVGSRQQIKNFINYEVKDLTIPQNFGEPPIAVGGPIATQL